MPLTLTIRNADRLDNGSPLALVLDRRGGVIGRAPTSDWCLPDPQLHISSRHCEVQYRDGGYTLVDVSTNGTFLLGSEARLSGPHPIAPGDVFCIGQFEVAAALDDQAAAQAAARDASPPPPAWSGWQTPEAVAQPSDAARWGAAPQGSAISGTGSMSQSWAPPAADIATPGSGGWGAPPAASPSPAADRGWGGPPDTPSAGGGWNSPAAAPAPTAESAWATSTPVSTPASGWSSAVADAAPPPAGDDIWGRIAASNVVDWARGGFGSPPPPPPVMAPPAAMPPPPSAAAVAAKTTPPSAQSPVASPSAAASGRAASAAADRFLAAAAIDRAALKQGEAEALAQAGDVLRRLIAGLVVMLEARARAKSQLGAAGTSLEFDGNNPLKFARTPEQALLQLLNPVERGFMPADRAVEDAFRDLQAHQVATLKAMQGALRATLDRFSPTAIGARVEAKGILSKVLPGARDAALWKAYEREFSGVAQGSDEAFMDVFAKEFRACYEEQARKK